MAIYHFSMKTFSRSKGQTATASIAYRSGTRIECDREGRTHDYSKKTDILHTKLFLPPNSPEWAKDRATLWNNVERAEKRKNSTVAREFEVALPHELSKDHRIALVADFARQIVSRHGCAVDACLHDDHRSRTPNHHAHIMLTTRKLEQTGFTQKTRELDNRNSGEVDFWREQWAKTVNAYLEANYIMKNDQFVQIDHRSLKDQGIDRQPTIKMGVQASAMERKGKKTDKGDYNRVIKTYKPEELTRTFKVMLKHAQEMSNKVNFIHRRLPEVKRDIQFKQPNLYQALDQMGISTAPPEVLDIQINIEPKDSPLKTWDKDGLLQRGLTEKQADYCLSEQRRAFNPLWSEDAQQQQLEKIRERLDIQIENGSIGKEQSRGR
ncbi:MobQ family relaxase [Acinetobacter nectaris]|uniref:MobQ family relaxase n=1 Tax=Acinetobacter nectaris TaxID=1219382 RepID=UPI001F1E27A8|nr:MobQ family relaxase [Acinetobacter nectaris]MCF9035360.1 MobA/MobL family protein [Acinetobacter nectaris]